MRLSELWHGLDAEVLAGAAAAAGALDAVEVTSVVADSRAVTVGSLFCCVPGEHADGHEFAPTAVQNGAVAIVAERRVEVPVPQAIVRSTRQVLGPLAARFHGHPSRAMEVVGVTGTNGKTTTVHLLRAILAAAGRRAAIIGTLTGARTTPEAPDLQSNLAEMRDTGTTAVAMEVSSHALAQHRVDGTWFAAAVFTNLSQDHLDFHGTMDEYFTAKRRLFTPAFTNVAVVDAGDPYGRRLIAEPAVRTTPYSIADAGDLSVGATESRFVWRDVPIRVPLGGEFNVRNALAAATTAAELDIAIETIATGLDAAGPVPGRFQAVDEGQAFTVVVDYAHTPDALGEVLRAARQIAAGRQVLLVFGAGGDRDRSKRPQMGAVASELADAVFLTSDNPRSEDPAAIITAVQQGVRGPAALTVEPDRRHAIELAVRAARPGDVVVIAGKGHETTQTVGDDVFDFDDRAVAADAIRRVAS